MMNPKIVFFDIDDTLYRKYTDTLRPSVKTAVAALRGKGILTALATGRSLATIPEKVRDMMAETGMDAVVTINGQFALLHGKTVHEVPMDAGLMGRVCAHLDGLGMDYAFVGGEGIAVSALSECVCRALKHIASDFFADKDYFSSKPVYQMLVFAEEDEMPPWSDIVKREGLKTVRWHEEAVDLLPAGASKTDGIRSVVEALGLEMADVMAFGDGLNDVEMLSEVGFGVAMGNGEQAAKEAAKYVCPGVDEDGVLRGLQDLGVI